MVITKNPVGLNVHVNVLPEILVNVSYSEKVAKKNLYKIGTSVDAARILKNAFTPETFDWVEEFVILCLNHANSVLGFYKVSKGGITGTCADPRIILTVALNCVGTTSIILAHNHPSGQTNPSQADEKVTFKISEAARLLDIRVLDHIILGDNDCNEFYSFADNGRI